MRIRYTDNQSGNAQTLYYFTTDISDGGIKATPGFLKFCQHLGIGASFLKSSSYLLFESGFATIRNFILDHSNMIVQDDSGIPLAYFDPNKWNMRFFGVYLGPIDIFKQHYQPRLRELYRTKQSAAARIRIRLPLELQGSESDRRYTQVTSQLVIPNRLEESVEPSGNFEGSFDSACAPLGGRKGVKICGTTNTENRRPDNRWPSAADSFRGVASPGYSASARFCRNALADSE